VGTIDSLLSLHRSCGYHCNDLMWHYDHSERENSSIQCIFWSDKKPSIVTFSVTMHRKCSVEMDPEFECVWFALLSTLLFCQCRQQLRRKRSSEGHAWSGSEAIIAPEKEE